MKRNSAFKGKNPLTYINCIIATYREYSYVNLLRIIWRMEVYSVARQFHLHSHISTPYLFSIILIRFILKVYFKKYINNFYN